MEGYTVFEALREEPGEIDGGVDADGGKCCGGGDPWGEGGGRNDAELWGLARCCFGMVFGVGGNKHLERCL